MKLLTICIPTYNRSTHVINQLRFLQRDYQPYVDLIDIKVCDNFSDNLHIANIREFHSNYPFFELFVNEINLGLIGNIYRLLEVSNSKYVWFLGDDDILLEGIIDNMIKILNDDSHTYYLFHNHSVFQDDPANCESTINLSGYTNMVENGRNCLMDLFTINGSINMFMSACIYPVKTLHDFLSIKRDKLIVDPLLFSFYSAAVNDVYIENSIFILDKISDTTWSKESGAVYSWLVPYALIELIGIKYSKFEIKTILLIYYRKNKGNYFRMLVQSPYIYKRSIISVLGLRQFDLIVPSLIFNAKRIFEKFLSNIKSINI